MWWIIEENYSNLTSFYSHFISTSLTWREMMSLLSQLSSTTSWNLSGGKYNALRQIWPLDLNIIDDCALFFNKSKSHLHQCLRLCPSLCGTLVSPLSSLHPPVRPKHNYRRDSDIVFWTNIKQIIPNARQRTSTSRKASWCKPLQGN